MFTLPTPVLGGVWPLTSVRSMNSTQFDPTDSGGRPAAPDGDSGLRKATDSRQELRSLGDFHLLRRLGEGGMGAVYLGYDERNDRRVAIKILADQLASNQAYIDRFYPEAKSGA